MLFLRNKIKVKKYHAFHYQSHKKHTSTYIKNIHKKHTSTTLALVKNRFNIRGDISTKPNTSIS